MGTRMETAQPSPRPAIKEPKLWHYALGCLLLFVLWVILLVLWIRPRVLQPGGSILVHLMVYLLPPIVAVTAAYLLHWRSVRIRRLKQHQQETAERLEAERQRQDEEALDAAVLGQKRFTLEVLALGVALEYLGQSEIWEEIQSQESPALVLSDDPNDYPNTAEEKERRFREREAEV